MVGLRSVSLWDKGVGDGEGEHIGFFGLTGRGSEQRDGVSDGGCRGVGAGES